MHELSICASLASIVEQHCAGRSVARVNLDIGYLRQVVPETLAYSWEVVVSGTPLAGSVLEINHVPAVIVCRRCGTRTTIDEPVFWCECGSSDVDVVQGNDLVLTSLELVPATP